MRILVSYRGIPHAREYATGASVVRALEQLGHEAIPYGWYYQTREPLAKRPDKVDLLIWMECNDQDPQYMELAGLNCPKVMWEFDTALHPQFTVQLTNAIKFNKVFLGNPKFVNGNATYLPYAVDPLLFHPPSEGTEREGVIMVGSPFPERVEFCKKHNIELISGIKQDDYARLLRRSKAQVHYHNSGGEDLLVMRYWETLGSGTALICEGNEQLDGILKYPGSYINLNVWLGQEGKFSREHLLRVGEQGLNSVQQNHTYTHRCQTILDSLEGIL